MNTVFPWSIWKERIPGRRYVLAGDPSMGGAKDPNAAIIWEMGNPPWEQVAQYHGHLDVYEQAFQWTVAAHYYNGALMAVEDNSWGHAVVKEVDRLGGLQVTRAWTDVAGSKSRRVGWYTGKVSRNAALAAGQHVLAHDLTIIRSTAVANELLRLARFVDLLTGVEKVEAPPGDHDDLAIAFCIGAYVLVNETPPEIMQTQEQPRKRVGPIRVPVDPDAEPEDQEAGLDAWEPDEAQW